MIKRILYAVIALFVFSVCFAGGITDKYKSIIAARGVMSGGGDTLYFGAQSDKSTPSGSFFGASDYYINADDTLYQCPGSGTVTVVELSTFAQYAAGQSTGNIRLAVYDTSDNLICQGDGEITPSNGETGAWATHSGLSGACQLTAGNFYRIGISRDSANVKVLYHLTGDSTDFSVGSQDYTGGWPATRTVSGSTQVEYMVVVGVQ